MHTARSEAQSEVFQEANACDSHSSLSHCPSKEYDVMQTNEIKQTKGDTGSPLRSMTKIPDSFLLVREHESRFDVIPTFFGGLCLT